jgi:hypothetical protein
MSIHGGVYILFKKTSRVETFFWVGRRFLIPFVHIQARRGAFAAFSFLTTLALSSVTLFFVALCALSSWYFILYSSDMSLASIRAISSAKRGKEVRKAIDRMSELERDKYTLDNVEQCEQLATDLKYLVGRQYYDDDNGVKYLVDSIDYEESYKAVIGYRRASDGKLHPYDDAPHFVCGDGGILQLVDLWGIDGREADVRWPESNQEWAQMQRECAATMSLNG